MVSALAQIPLKAVLVLRSTINRIAKPCLVFQARVRILRSALLSGACGNDGVNQSHH